MHESKNINICVYNVTLQQWTGVKIIFKRPLKLYSIENIQYKCLYVVFKQFYLSGNY